MIPIYISFGYEETKLCQGWTAGICPYCETLQAHEVFEVYRETLLYHINLNDNSRVWTLVRCDLCLFSNIVFQRDQVIVDTAWTPMEGLEPLVARTNPTLTPTASVLARQRRPTMEDLQRMLSAVETYCRVPSDPATQVYLTAIGAGAGSALLGYGIGWALSLDSVGLTVPLAVVAGMTGALIAFVGMTMAMRKTLKVRTMAEQLRAVALRHRLSRTALLVALDHSRYRSALVRRAIEAACPAT